MATRKIKTISRCEAFVKKLRRSEKILASVLESDSITDEQFKFAHLALCTWPIEKSRYGGHKIGITDRILKAYITHPHFTSERFCEFVDKRLQMLSQRNFITLLRADIYKESTTANLKPRIIDATLATRRDHQKDGWLEAWIKKPLSYKRRGTVIDEFTAQFIEVTDAVNSDLAVAFLSEDDQLRELSFLLLKKAPTT